MAERKEQVAEIQKMYKDAFAFFKILCHNFIYYPHNTIFLIGSSVYE